MITATKHSGEDLAPFQSELMDVTPREANSLGKRNYPTPDSSSLRSSESSMPLATGTTGYENVVARCPFPLDGGRLGWG